MAAIDDCAEMLATGASLWMAAAYTGRGVSPDSDPSVMTRWDCPSSALPARRDAHAPVVRRIAGLRLRELLVLILLRNAAPMPVAELVTAVHGRGFRIEGRAGKVVSDQLRYELARGRVQRVGRGVYVAGTVTRQARWRMERRITRLQSGSTVDTELATATTLSL